LNAVEKGLANQPQNEQFWRALSETAEPTKLGEAWLTLLLDHISGQTDATVDGAVLALGEPASRDYRHVASFGHQATPSAALLQAGEKAMARLSPVIQPDPETGRCWLGYPLQFQQNLYGCVALELTLPDMQKINEVVRIVQWAAPVCLFRLLPPDLLKQQPHSAEFEVVKSLVDGLVATQPTADCLEWFCNHLANRYDLSRVAVLVLSERFSVLHTAVSGAGELAAKTELSDLLAELSSLAAGENLSETSLLREPDSISAAISSAERVGWANWTIFDAAGPYGRNRLVLAVSAKVRPGEQVLEAVDNAFRISAPTIIWRQVKDQSTVSQLLSAFRSRCRALSRRPLRTFIQLSLAVAVTAALAWPTPYQVVADAAVDGSERRILAAPFDSYIRQVKVRPGDEVESQQVLLKLDDNELKLQQLNLKARYVEVLREIDAARGEQDIARSKILEAGRDRVEAELKLINDKISRTVVAAPYAGVIVNGDLSDAIGTPVRQGDVLAEISPLSGYRLLIDVEQGDIDELVKGQEGNAILESLPYTPLPFTVSRVTPVASALDGKTVFRVEADLLNPPEALRPGMKGIAKVATTERPRIWNWTHEAWDWLRLKLWTWWP